MADLVPDPAQTTLAVCTADSRSNPMHSQELVSSYPPLDYVIPNAEDHQELMVKMRKACGWDKGLVPLWFEQQKEGSRVMALFYLPDTTTAVGMGGVEMQDFEHGDKDVADPLTKRGCVVSLFLYKKYRGKSYLGRMLEICEEIARQKELKTLTIYGLSKARGYEKFGYQTFKMEDREYSGNNIKNTRFLQKTL
ncbi:hypothetical protein BGX34_006160 [Mortierella sp. NVP85]|nr:hypothetical protein BGX34_006160 [Mortierella sp. NVP85]